MLVSTEVTDSVGNIMKVLFGAQARSDPHFQTGLLSNPGDLFFSAVGAAPSTSGVNVNSRTALTYGPYWRGVSLICGYLAKTPTLVLKKTNEGQERGRTYIYFPIGDKPQIYMG